MASRGQKALGTAATGAGIGASVGGPVGAGIGGGLGALFGLFQGDDPEIKVPTFTDIDLARDNPDLFKRLQENEKLLQEARRLYDRRRQGITSEEDRMYKESLADVNRGLVNSGLAGTSDGMMMAARARSEMDAKIAERIAAEELGLLNNLQGATRGMYDLTKDAYAATMAPSLMEYQAAMGDQAAKNQFYSGLFSGGLSMLGQGLNKYDTMEHQAKLANSRPQGFYAPIPYAQGQQFPYSPSNGVNYSSPYYAFAPGYSPYGNPGVP